MKKLLACTQHINTSRKIINCHKVCPIQHTIINTFLLWIRS